MSARRFLALLVLPALLTACPGSEPPDEPVPGEASLVVGVQSEDFGGLVEAVKITASVDGKVTSDETIAIGASNPTALPKEVTVRGLPGARVEVIVEATTSQAQLRGGLPGTPVVSRRAATRLVAARKKLLRIQLESRCVTFNAPGSSSPPAPTCAAPQTCSAGRCVTEEIAPEQLEEYATGWASAPPDICRPANHGPPELFLGTGQTDFANLSDGQTLSLERGPQGGHHIWIAARMRNLRQSGSRTTITGKLADDPASPINPAAYVFTFDRDEGNFCKLWGLRFQLDSGATDLGAAYKRFLGKKLEVTVEVIDSTGASAKATKTIQIADKLLCPDGTTTSCNN